ncbi:hypothetical protein (nucleomorph) [Guillardia theta]|uniref:Uncharacterized protein n=1 Tax=Guillardia theta TaxID=55529 RepID=Q98RZ4_GUITH|nr:hypothetical protein GTHECHR1014 [Guillardia theta]AAK39806.1 hypothetical protein [Guillardia theta]
MYFKIHHTILLEIISNYSNFNILEYNKNSIIKILIEIINLKKKILYDNGKLLFFSNYHKKKIISKISNFKKIYLSINILRIYFQKCFKNIVFQFWNQIDIKKKIIIENNLNTINIKLLEFYSCLTIIVTNKSNLSLDFNTFTLDKILFKNFNDFFLKKKFFSVNNNFQINFLSNKFV